MEQKHYDWKYKLILHKSYFDKGWGVTNYLKYVIAFFGLASLNVKATMYISVGYGIFCYFFGWAYFYWGWVRTEREVDNNHNWFVQEMREKFK